MAYTPVPISTDIGRVGQQIKQAKDNGAYAGNEKTWDDAVMQATLTNVRSAIRQNQASNQVTMDNGKVAKKVVDEMEALVKKKGKKITDSDLSVIQTGHRSVKRCVEAAGSDSVALMAALQDYRGGWVDEARKLLADKTRIAEATQLRQASIDENKKFNAIRVRMDEYEVRIGAIAKTAATLAGQGAADDSQVVKDFTTAFDKAAGKLDDDLFQANKFFTGISQLKPSDVAKPQDLKVRQSGLVNAATFSKSARGSAKTTDILVSNFKKTAAGFTGPAKTERDAALKAAATKLKPLMTQLKAVDALESKATKHLATLAKGAGK